MASGIDGIQAVSGGASTPTASVTAQKNVTTASAPTSTAAAVHNPRVVQDPQAGFITQYLNSNGSEVVFQTPSAVTVAYLQQGLTADGLAKKQAVTTTA